VGTMAWRKRVPLILGGLIVIVMSLNACGGGGTKEEPAAKEPMSTQPGQAPADEPAGEEPNE
jgi:hypothetical protein